MDYKEKVIALLKSQELSKEQKEKLEDIFPELKESEDEKVRKEIHTYLDWLDGRNKDYQPKGDYSIKDMIAWLEKQGDSPIKWYKNTKDYKPQKYHSVLMKTTHGIAEGEWNGEHWIQYRWSCIIKDSDVIAWMVLSSLEKQGEQKPADKVEPKFHEGDWIVYNMYDEKDIDKIVKFDNDKVSFVSGEWLYIHQLNEDCKLWSIQDAKDGDVLAAHECYVIFKEIDGLNIKCYCTYHYMNNPSFHINTLQNKSAFHPATKEQRDLLFQKMHEAGYMWDSESKQLLSLKAEPSGEQKPAWSEEDEEMFDAIIADIQFTQKAHTHDDNQAVYEREIDWLKSLKERI